MGTTSGRGQTPEYERLTGFRNREPRPDRFSSASILRKLFVLTVTPSCEEYCGTECERTFDRVNRQLGRVISR